MGILAIKHRISVNNLNISRELSELDYESFFSITVRDVEIVPLNFKFNEDLPLNVLKKIYTEGAYIILNTYDRKFIFKIEDTDTYLVEEEDSFELEEIKRLTR